MHRSEICKMKKVLLLSLSAVLLVTACKKSKPETKQDEVCIVKSIELHGNKIIKYSFSYDDKGRIVKKNNSWPYYWTYTYLTDKIILGYSHTSSTDTLDLDANGRIKYRNGYTYKYNEEGYLIEAITKEGETMTLTYQNGNPVKIVAAYQLDNGPYIETTTFEYNNEPYQTLRGLFGQPLFQAVIDDSSLVPYLGKSPKNMLIKETVKQGDFLSYVTTYTYEKDTQGNINSIKEINPEGVQREEKLTYQCK